MLLLFFPVFSWGQYSLKIHPENPYVVAQMAGLISEYNALSKVGAKCDFEFARNFETTFVAPVKGLDNQFLVHKSHQTTVLNFRGSQPNAESWMANTYASIIPAKGVIEMDGSPWHYNFSDADGAGVHSGYALAIAFMWEDLKKQIHLSLKEDIDTLYIIGHSQGGALASLFHAYISQNDLGLSHVFVKAITFGAPMVGNKKFVDWYNLNLGYRFKGVHIANKEDMVPDLPLEYNDENYIEKHLFQMITDPENINWTNLTKDVIGNYFEEDIQSIVGDIGGAIDNHVDQYKVPVQMPEPLKDVNYRKLEKRILLSPIPIPKKDKEKESSEEGWFSSWLPEEPLFYQHYGTSYLKAWLLKFFPSLAEEK